MCKPKFAAERKFNSGNIELLSTRVLKIVVINVFNSCAGVLAIWSRVEWSTEYSRLVAEVLKVVALLKSSASIASIADLCPCSVLFRSHPLISLPLNM